MHTTVRGRVGESTEVREVRFPLIYRLVAVSTLEDQPPTFIHLTEQSAAVGMER